LGKENDKIVFKNLFKDVMGELSLLDESDEKDILIQKVETLMLDTSLFNYNDQSLLIYIDSEHTSLYILQTLIKTFTQVSRFFQMKPLISYYQNLKDYHVLALSADSFTLLVGNRYGLKKVSHIENISLEVMFENQERKNFVTRGSYGGSDSKGVFHGHGDTKKLKIN
jgi:hypothetical protein